MVLAASPPELATIIDANPGFEVQDRASMGLGDDALVASHMVQFDLGSIHDLLIVGQSFKLQLLGDSLAKIFHVESVEENVPSVLAYSGYLAPQIVKTIISNFLFLSFKPPHLASY